MKHAQSNTSVRGSHFTY